MANTKSAAKRARQTVRRTTQNRRAISAVKVQAKSLRATIKSGVKAEAQKIIPKLSSLLDRAAKSGRVHQNKANRLKSRSAKAAAKLAA